MSEQAGIKDLVALVADGQMEFCLRGILTRQEALRIRNINVDIFVHPDKDPGCLRRGENFLQPFSRRYAHALIMLDREGSGREHLPRETMEADLEVKLRKTGWDERGAAIVLDPELEMWVWSDSPEVDEVLGWSGRSPCLRDWLCQQGYLSTLGNKPSDPKSAFLAALRKSRKQKSSMVFFELAQRVSMHRCIDQSFIKLKSVLQKWFSCNY
ncbi:MAG: hypothetical protein JXB10_17640 [Pirellulales bacterium]|nr:hypothetical protein [Pirellulales bacterium]